MLLTRRQKRLLPLLLLLSLPILLLIIRLAWGLYADHHLAQTRASLKSQGFRVYPEDFSPKSIITESKPAALILHTAQTLTISTPQRTAIENTLRFGLSADTTWNESDLSLIRQAFVANPSAFEDLTHVANLPPESFAKPFLGTTRTGHVSHLPTLYALGDIHQLAYLFFAAALDAHHRNHDLEAIQHFHRILLISQKLSPECDTTTAVITASLNSLVAHGIVRIQNQLKIAPADQPYVRQLIVALMNDQPFDDQLAATCEAQTLTFAQDTQIRSPWAQAWHVSPILSLQDARNTLYACKLSAATQTRCWPAVRRIYPRNSDEFVLDLYTIRTSFYINPEHQLIHFRSAVDRHAAAALLAAALYRADHQGQNPTSLATLIPSYLPTMPMDRFTPTPEPLRFRSSPQILVWSVGEDAVDDNASTLPNSLPNPSGLWTSKDAVYPYSPPASSSSP